MYLPCIDTRTVSLSNLFLLLSSLFFRHFFLQLMHLIFLSACCIKVTTIEIRQLEESLRNTEAAFRAADALQKEQEEKLESVRHNLEETIRSKDEQIGLLTISTARISQQHADSYPPLVFSPIC